MCESGVAVEPLAFVLDVFLPLYVFLHSGLGDLGGGGAFFVRVSALRVGTGGGCLLCVVAFDSSSSLSLLSRSLFRSLVRSP